MPSIHRGLLYNLALDVYPVYMESKEFVIEQKKAIYYDLTHALEIMGYINNQTPKHKLFYAMYLLETRQLANATLINVIHFLKINLTGC